MRARISDNGGKLEVIVNGDAPTIIASVSGGIETAIPPKTTEQKIARRNELKAKSTLLLAIPDNSSSTNEAVNTAHDVLSASLQGQAFASTYADDVMFSFFANQSHSPQFDNEDLEQIDTVDLEKMDLKWQDTKELGNRNRDNSRRVVPVETHANALVVTDGIGYDWIYQVKEGPAYFALMVHSSSGSSSSDTECEILSKANLEIIAYQLGLESLETRIVVHQKNEAVFEEDIAFLKYDVKARDNSITELKNHQISPKDKTGLGYDSQVNERDLYNKSKVFESASDSSVNESEEDNNQVNDRYKAGEGYHAISPPYTKNFMPPRPDYLLLVVSTAERNGENAVKSSACWIWRPTRNVIDHISKDNGSYKLKRFNYVDLQGRLNGCSRHLTKNKSFLTDYQKIDGGIVAFKGSPKGGKISGKGKAGHEKASDHKHILLPFMPSNSPLSLSTQSLDDKDVDEVPGKGNEGVSKGSEIDDQERTDSSAQDVNTARLSINTANTNINISSLNINTIGVMIQVKQKDNGIFISQDKYVADILKKFDFTTVKTASTPMEPNKALIKDAKAEDIDVHLYRSMIRSLMYLTASRPDIMFIVCAYARFQVTPNTSHLHVVKRIFRYLKGQPKLGLWYPRDSPFDLEAFFDSDYARASLDRKSTTEGYQFLGKRLILWQCKKHTIVANYTTEAEYVAAANCYTKEVQITATIDWKVKLVSEASIRRHLKLEDSDGISTFPNTEIFEQLALMGTAFTKIIMKVKKLEKIVKLTKARRRTKVVVLDDEDVAEDTSKQEFEFETEDISTVKTLVYIRRSASKDKEQLDEEERQRISRVHEEASSFNIKEWEDIQATIKADEELALRIQAEERERYSKTKKARLLLKRLSFDELKNLFEAIMKKVKTFTPIESDFNRIIPKITDESSKRATEELEQESSKRQKARESSEPREKNDDLTQEDLEQMLMIVLVEEVYVKALQERFSTTEPTYDKEKELWVERKRLFKPDVDDTLWKLQRISIYKRANDYNVGKQAVSRTIFRDGKRAFKKNLHTSK
nr:putative ribonuclease H-like domain-containing protein [Tanacetum cinerariifolium]